MYNHHVHSMKLDDLTSQIIFQQSPISTQIFDPSGVSLMANKAWEKLWGVKHEQIGTYNILKDKQLVETGTMPFIKRGFEGETVLVPAIRYEPGKTIDLSGVVSYRYVSALIYPVKDKKGNIIHIVLQHQDVTDKFNYDKKLQENKE